MNCTTCGTALVNGGACTVCNPWQTPAATAAPGSAAPNAGMPAARPAGAPQAGMYGAGPAPVPKAFQRMVDRRPAEPVDMARAFRISLVVTVLQSAALALIAVVDFVMARSTDLADASSVLLLAILPLLLTRILAGASGGWLGGAVSNIKLRPDIGFGWLFALPTMKRMLRIGMVYTYGFLLFILVRITQHPDTVSGFHTWLNVTGVVYLAAAVLQGANFAAFAVPTYRIVRARLAVPPPWAAYAPVPAPAVPAQVPPQVPVQDCAAPITAE